MACAEAKCNENQFAIAVPVHALIGCSFNHISSAAILRLLEANRNMMSDGKLIFEGEGEVCFLKSYTC